jgi:hypothetical protein
MNSMNKSWFKLLTGLSVLFVLVLLLSGCGLESSPTASRDEARPLWSPAPGDQLAAGRDVPIVNSTYWQDVTGMEANPWRIPVSTIVPIDEDGGMVTLGLHNYQIPAGGIHEERFFSLAYASLSGVAVDCGPSPYQFDLPATLSLSYRGTQYDAAGADPSQLQIWYAAPDGQTIPLASHVDLSRKIVSASVDHFSRYILG